MIKPVNYQRALLNTFCPAFLHNKGYLLWHLKIHNSFENINSLSIHQEQTSKHTQKENITVHSEGM